MKPVPTLLPRPLFAEADYRQAPGSRKSKSYTAFCNVASPLADAHRPGLKCERKWLLSEQENNLLSS